MSQVTVSMTMQILDLNNHFKEYFSHGVGIMQHNTPVCGPVHPRQDPLGSHLLGLCALGRDLSHRQVGLPFDHPSSIINDISHAAIILALHSNQYIFFILQTSKARNSHVVISVTKMLLTIRYSVRFILTCQRID